MGVGGSNPSSGAIKEIHYQCGFDSPPLIRLLVLVYFLNGGSSGLRCCLASIMSRRVRFPRPPPNYLSKALSGCVHGLGPCGPGSNPGRETNLCSIRLMVRHRFCSPAIGVRFLDGAPGLRMLTANFYTLDF